ncbi:energy transducer TonB [Microbulbifer sp. 2201CG32-9]|uniref:energy transducer TonB n=1 Tax=Microbulbifer sp. 2201CG32-9 TaxID=3232309 RepID=UPI00345B4F77
MSGANWQLLSWRAAYVLGAVLWLFGPRANSALSMDDTSTAGGFQRHKAVALNFVAPAKQLRQDDSAQVPAAEPAPPMPDPGVEPVVARRPAGRPHAAQPIQGPSASAALPVPRPASPEAAADPVETRQLTEKQRPAESRQGPRQEPLATASASSAGQQPGVHAEPVIAEPVFTSPPEPPRYPPLARKRGQEGIVLVEVWLDERGRQTKLTLLESSGVAVLDEAAIAAVSHWQFEPRRENGIGAESRVRIPVEFALR